MSDPLAHSPQQISSEDGSLTFAPTPRYVYLPSNLPVFTNPSVSKSSEKSSNSTMSSSEPRKESDQSKSSSSVNKKTSSTREDERVSLSLKRTHSERSVSSTPSSQVKQKSKQHKVSGEQGSSSVKKPRRDSHSSSSSTTSALPPTKSSSTAHVEPNPKLLSHTDRESSVQSIETSIIPPSVISSVKEDESVGPATGIAKKKKRRDHRYISKNAHKPCIDSLTIVKNHIKSYRHMSQTTEEKLNTENVETVTLEYPGNNEVFPLVVAKREGEYSPLHDIYTTTQMIAAHCLDPKDAEAVGDSKQGILRSIIKYCHRRDVSKLKESLSHFNRIIKEIKDRKGFEEGELTGPAAPYPLLTHILEQAYSRSVAPSSHLLNKYEGFSNNVYGEIKQPFVHDLIKQANIKPHHVFLDMGSGIGNVVLQVAAQTLCECYGIEIMETPARLAARQRAEFLSRMRYYAKPCGRIQLKRGDFLEDSEIYQIITKADVIFVNNYAFDAELNQNILARFLDLKETARVISLRSFVPVDRRPSLRRSNAIESIFTVKEYHFGRETVSWMPEGGKYFIHTVDRSQLASLLE